MSISTNDLANKLIHVNHTLNWLPFNKPVYHENDDSLYVVPKELLVADGAVYIKGGKFDGCRIHPINLNEMVPGREHICKAIFEDVSTYRPEMNGVIVTVEAIQIAYRLNKLSEDLNIRDINVVVNGLANLIQLCTQFK